MPHKIEAECPKCDKKAKNFEEIEKMFGWRVPGGKKIPQSYCRACRSKH